MGVKWCKTLIKSRLYWILIVLSIAIIVYVSYYFATKTHQENLVGNQDVAKQWSEGRIPSTTNWHEYVDIIYYINLDHREDRRKEFLVEMERMGVPSDKIVRVPAVYKPKQGDWGCSLSHVKTMKMFQETSYTNCIVFEDDFMFTEDLGKVDSAFQSFFNNDALRPDFVGSPASSPNTTGRLTSLTSQPSAFGSNISHGYNVCMLSGSVIQSEEMPNTSIVLKLLEAQTTSGYMVSKTYCPTLLANYQEGAALIEQSYQEKGKGVEIQHAYCVDQYWKRLQPLGNWYIFNPKLGKQRDSFSDIMGGNVKMEV